MDPNLTRKTEQLKWVFSAQQKADRREAAKWYLERLSTDKKFLHAVAFTDHMTVYCMPACRTVWCDKRDDVSVINASVGRGSKKVVKLSFYIAVNAVVGGVALVFTTRTTDKGGKVYKIISFTGCPVSSAIASSLGHADSYHSEPCSCRNN